MDTMLTEYTQKFIQLQIVKYIPEGIDPYLHINSRKEIYNILSQGLKSGHIPHKLSVIKLFIIGYKDILWTKFSTLN